MRRSTHHGDSAALGLVAGVVLLLGIGTTAAISTAHIETPTCTVESKDRTTKREGGSDMRVYTTDCGVLSVADSFLDFDFSSSDRFASIKEGKRYEFTTRGWRVPLLSWFPNIIKIKEVAP